jgi:hypothetical protein
MSRSAVRHSGSNHFIGNCRSIEDFWCVMGIELVNLEIRPSFAFIPFEEHRQSVYTDCCGVKQ